ncbi:MAG: FAD-binding oxidoreductase [Nocardioides sp.]|uniref:NAD(P)/FAD-dependent oxidoreductase n=1 Tax=Nocardioides sp. TaxID=35761 RepID=UPI0039E25DBB
MLRTRSGRAEPRPHRSLWLEQALADEREHLATPPLSGRRRADICIVGGGYAGLWTAVRLKEADPSLDVTLLEADICGGGSSGRNAGFALSWWVKAQALLDLCGTDDGVWLCRQSQDAVEEIGQFASTHGLDIGFAKQGWLWGASSEAQIGASDDAVALAQAVGADVYQRLDPGEVRERAGSAAFKAGVLARDAATLHPARLARGLRTVALGMGVTIYEGSPVKRLATGIRPAAVTERGRVEAERIVIALGPWSARLQELRALERAMVIVSSDEIATEPIPHLLAEHGPKGQWGISDSRLMVRNARTHEGRFFFGIAGHHLAYGTRVGRSFEYGARRTKVIERTFRQLYPTLAQARITHAWGGPVDRTEAGVPIFGRLPDAPDVIYCAGFSGNGVGPAVLAGHVLTSLALDRDDRWASTGLIREPRRAFPPEPARSTGGIVVRRAVRACEDAADNGKTAPLPVRALAALAPAGLVRSSGEVGR